VESRLFNQTGLRVTPIGLGLAALGRPGYINLGHAADLGHNYDVAAMEAHAHSVLDAAWQAGIRYYDAARSYGRAEQFLSSWLQSRGIDPQAVVVGSKWGYTYTAGWRVEADKHEVKAHTLPVLRRQIGESRALLGEYLKLYQIHSATLDSGVLDNREVLEELAVMRDEGLVIGLSLSGLHQAQTLKKALAIQIDGRPLFRSVQATWNLLSRGATDALSEAHDTGMGVIVKEALANGRLTSRNEDPAFEAKRRLLQDVSTEAGVPIDALALAAVIAQPWADIVLSGAAQVDQLNSNVKGLQVAWPEEIATQLADLTEPEEQYWKTRGRLEWN
jgi:aryl-alcohol dehydrogenase-like predicted oxidoreductase